jgi:tetratricopeptide (TPR) repeat protein
MHSFNFRSVPLTAVLLLTLASHSGAQEPATPQPSEADTLLAQAIELHKAGDLLGAIQKYQVALDMAPERGDVRSNLAVAYAGLGRVAEAVEEYRKALALRDDPAIRLNLGLALYKSGRAGDAIPEFQRVLEADPQHRQAALLLADCLLQTGRDQEVIDLLTPREPAFAEDLAYAYVLGMALVRQGDSERGQVLIDRIFRSGESAEGRLLMGMAHLDKRDYPTALKELARAVELNPELPSLHVLHGRALLNMGNREAAIREFRRELERDPNNFDANVQLGNLYRMDGRNADALQYYRRAADVRPGDVAIKHGMAAAHLGLGDAERARELLEQVVQESPSFVEGHVLLATTYYRLKRRDDGDRERKIVERLNAENQAKQPGARPGEAQAPAGTASDAPPAGTTPPQGN